MATDPMPIQHPGGSKAAHEIRIKVIAGLIVLTISSLAGAIWAVVFGSTVVHDIFFPDKVDIAIALTGKAHPGDSVELFPLSMQAVLDHEKKTSFQEVEFPKIRNKTLEVRVGTKDLLKKVTDVQIGERPKMNIQYEVK
jgi:hypothetical protein